MTKAKVFYAIKTGKNLMTFPNGSLILFEYPIQAKNYINKCFPWPNNMKIVRFLQK